MPVPTSPRMPVWPGSARTTATAMPTGTARTSAMNAVETVPKMAGNAPKESVTGFQSTPTRKRIPNCLIAGAACCRSVSTMSTSTAGTAVATIETTSRKPSRGRNAGALALGLASTRAANFSGAAIGLGLTVEAVADAPHGHDLERSDAGELLAQPAHVHVHCL